MINAEFIKTIDLNRRPMLKKHLEKEEKMTFENLNNPTRELTPDELAMLAKKDPEALALTVTTDEDAEETVPTLH